MYLLGFIYKNICNHTCKCKNVYVYYCYVLYILANTGGHRPHIQNNIVVKYSENDN